MPTEHASTFTRPSASLLFQFFYHFTSPEKHNFQETPSACHKIRAPAAYHATALFEPSAGFQLMAPLARPCSWPCLPESQPTLLSQSPDPGGVAGGISGGPGHISLSCRITRGR